MDLTYNPHAERARRKNRSCSNLNHLTLAPLTAKLPLDRGATDEFVTNSTPPPHSISYLEGKSAPTTPRLLSRSPADHQTRSRSHHRSPSGPTITNANDDSVLRPSRKPQHWITTPRRRRADDIMEAVDHTDGDWLLRTGAIMSTETREFKGQAWLVSRQSSTSLTGMRVNGNEDQAGIDNSCELGVACHRGSRQSTSIATEDDIYSPFGSRLHSRTVSRSHSFTSRGNSLLLPKEDQDSYFANQCVVAGPEFVDLDERLEKLEKSEQEIMSDDEAAIRKLVRHGQNGKGSWVSNAISWALFSQPESDEDSTDEDDEFHDESLFGSGGRSRWPARHFEGISNVPEERIPAPNKEDGGWNDAAWLLSVASKVMF